ncbi:uncharacterized protein [Glycine max]|uniref:uncharacterized protein n=1 Tax=Glycine max TaxID=3847 RepID=UPI0003DE97DB|nr:uncharacterized protein LOC100812122 [Glycine max]|eukprot:XP_006601584.1 uncharacterized protein LOC100812122 [Glycine max]
MRTKNCRPAKVCWYLPIIPRFKRLFANAHDAKNLSWHSNDRKSDGLLRHPADSPQWKTIDHLYPEFGYEPRNLRLALASDGMNPYGSLSSNHSSWPILLMIYNLPPWLCILREYIILCMMIAGPRKPGNDIDVYLMPLIEDLKQLWEEGVDVWDANMQQTFRLRTMVFCTINDFPAYGNLSGYSVKGHHACPICPSEALTGNQVHDRVKEIVTVFGKSQKKTSSPNNMWKKCSIFLIFHTGKTKDGLKFRQDLVDMGIREQLHPISQGRRTYLPPACHTLSTTEKISFCQCLWNLKVPQGYSSNIKSLVALNDLKLVGLKSHDCRVLMQQLFPVAIRDIWPDKVRVAITRLCFLFNAICSKVINPHQLDDLENEAAIVICQLEMYFPPSFFDIMVHLIVHLVREIWLCGPVFLRWMYPIERYMKVLKGYTKNQYRPEASIVERYVAEEAIEFCSQYMETVEAVGNSGVIVEAHSEHFSRASDNNPIEASMPYLGVIEEIWELDYNQFRVSVFKCKWVNGNTGVHRDEMGFTLVDLNKVGYKEEPFIMAEQARQVFYIQDPNSHRLSVVLQGMPIGLREQIHDASLDICETPRFCTKMPSICEQAEVDDVHAIRHDHAEGSFG